MDLFDSETFLIQQTRVSLDNVFHSAIRIFFPRLTENVDFAHIVRLFCFTICRYLWVEIIPPAKFFCSSLLSIRNFAQSEVILKDQHSDFRLSSSNVIHLNFFFTNFYLDRFVYKLFNNPQFIFFVSLGVDKKL